MKFTVEIYRASDGTEKLLRRATVFALNPLVASKTAKLLFAEWKKRNATGVRLFNAQGQQLYEWDE